jgi:Rieske Fe-S protein
VENQKTTKGITPTIDTFCRWAIETTMKHNTVTTLPPSQAEQELRRSFLKTALASVGLTLSTAAVASLVQGCETDETAPTSPSVAVDVNISGIPGLAEPGNIVTRAIPGVNSGIPVFISRISATTFLVFTTVCTHAGCTVEHGAHLGDELLCPCHQSVFSKEGTVISGPIGGGSVSNLPRFASAYNPTTQILSITP